VAQAEGEAEDARTDARTDDADVRAYTLSVAEAAERLGKSADTVRRYIRAGDLPALRVQGERLVEYRLRPEDVQSMHARMHAYVGARLDRQAPDARLAHVPEAPASPGIAAAEALLERLVAPLAAELARRDGVIAEKDAQLVAQAEDLGRLREQARVAEERAALLEAQIRRARRPWWRRLLG
jgi:excisionase family DNA binding protein